MMNKYGSQETRPVFTDPLPALHWSLAHSRYSISVGGVPQSAAPRSSYRNQAPESGELSSAQALPEASQSTCTPAVGGLGGGESLWDPTTPSPTRPRLLFSWGCSSPPSSGMLTRDFLYRYAGGRSGRRLGPFQAGRAAAAVGVTNDLG